MADLETAHRIIALNEPEHRPLVRTRFPEWEQRVQFWLVEDVEYVRPEVALAAIERQIDLLLGALRGSRSGSEFGKCRRAGFRHEVVKETASNFSSCVTGVTEPSQGEDYGEWVGWQRGGGADDKLAHKPWFPTLGLYRRSAISSGTLATDRFRASDD